MTKIYYDNDLIWELDVLDLTERKVIYGANLTVKSSFDIYGQLTSIESDSLFDMSYIFSNTTGNLLSRTQLIFNDSRTCIDTLTESFSYDDLDRLLEITNPADTLEVSYDASKKERIYSKTDAGEEYKYSASNNFQLTSIDSATSTLTNRPNMSISYTSFNKVDTISEGDYLITFDYGPNAERVKMQVTYDDTLQYTRYYFGSYELTEYPEEDDEEKTWFSSGSGIFGFHRVIDTSDHNFFIIKDHLGSVMTVANEDGDAVEFFSYDAWGRRRNDSTWAYDSTLTVEYTSRGYTGHEHIDETCLINMNGRVYDPLVGLFLSPDPVLQEPMNPLNYNRYSYVLNNPLKYTDPSGYTYYRKRFDWEEDVTESFRSGGGGGGGFRNDGRAYGDRISAMGGDPRGWGYNSSTETYWNSRTGERFDASDSDAMNKMGVRHQILWTTDENGDLTYVKRDEKGRGYYIVTGEYTSGKMVDVPIDFNGKAYTMRMLDIGIYRKNVYLSKVKSPIISNPHGWQGHNSWENFVMRVEQLDENLKYGKPGSERRATGQAPGIVKAIISPIVVIPNSISMLFNSEDMYGNEVNDAQRVFSLFSLATLFVPIPISNALGIPEEALLILDPVVHESFNN